VPHPSPLTPVAVAGVISASAPTSELTITITGVGPVGKVRGKVFGDAVSFGKKDNGVAVFAVEPANGQAVAIIRDLPPGRYAVAVFQDVKGIGKIATNLLGVPTVPYGFSNDARGTMGSPGFEAAAIDLAKDNLSIALKLR
jgi:uncharacterized protein (DUF2141 family)